MSLRFRIWILISCNFFCNSGIISSQTCSLPKPASLYVIQTSSCTATAQWSAVANAFGYKLQYRVSGTTTWTRISVGANILSRNINNLSGGLTYNFKVNAICSNNHLGKTQSKNLVMQNYCSMTPVIDSAKTISPGLVRLYLNHSPYLIYEIDYTDSLTNTSQSILMSNALAYFDVKNLIADHTYFFQVRSSCCINLYSAYSNTVSSHTYKLPNIVLFIMDDATDKSFNFDGGPSFFQTPAVDFLASEGMHLKNYFTVYSLCAPSRSTLITGLYPHQTGVTSNTNRNLPFAIPTIASVLGGTGYFNGWVGKVHLGNLVRPGFNIWYSGPVEGGTESYINPHFSDRFGNRLQINGHLTDVTTQLGINFLDSVPTGAPFMLILSQLSPHGPDVPRPQDSSYYTNYQMPLPSDFYRYDDDYPSFLYTNWNTLLYDTVHFSKQIESYYDMLKGDEASVQQFIDTLIARNLWDNTLFILTGDNGSLWGVHQLMNKRLPYEESMRIPGIIKYPSWFPAGTTYLGDVINSDIAPTILDAAGIDYAPYNMEGVSIRQLYNHEITRIGFLYESYWEDNYPDMPGVRTIRTDHYKYNRYNCINQTEEFFDIQNDSLELINLINDSSYQTLIQSYRLKLDSIELADHDNNPVDSLLPCSLINIHPLLKTNGSVSQQIVTSVSDPIKIFPDPVHDQLLIYCEGILQSATVYNLEGEKLLSTTDLTVHRINTSQLLSGMYLLELKFKNQEVPVVKNFVKQ